MSQRERDRLKVMALVLEGQRGQKEAGRLLGVSTRQVRRIQRRLEREGDGGIVHKLRGRPSNARHDPVERAQIIAAYRAALAGFGPTLAAEKLAAQGLVVSAESLRNWLVAEGLWQPRRKRQQHRQRRERRACWGELVQGDGSHHDWLEGRGPRMVLVAWIDDATSQLVARFYPGETTAAYMDLLGRYVRKHGRMVAVYVDRAGIFRAEDQHPDDPRPTLTQFARALGELGIELILANSPQAKGRVERSFQTAQDRLVKELRLAGASTLEAANEVLEKTYLPWFNRRCGVRAASPNDAHRPLHPSMHLGSILSLQEQRQVSNDYTIRLDNQVYQLLPPAWPGQRGGQVIIERRLDGTLHMRFKKAYLAYRPIGAAAGAPGALPPDPRSLAPQGIPAGELQDKGRAAETTRPPAVHSTAGRSGRTPALPYPPGGLATVAVAPRYRPAPNHPWRGKAVNSIWGK
jgi:transposase